MVKVNDIVKEIEKFAPKELAYSWDNTGFILGDGEKEVKKVFLTLDVFKETVDEAVKSGVDMIISHHPILFKGIQTVDYTSQQGYIVKELIKNDIALYSSHTSMDCAKGGINDVLANKLGIKDVKVIEKNPDFDACGLGRWGHIKKETTLKEYAEFVKEALNTPFVRVCGDLNKKIKTVAVGGGACDDLIPDAIKIGADVLVTADMKYHISAEAVEDGIAVIDAGHYPTEVFVTEIFEDIIKGMDVEIIKSTHKDVFKIL
ncbi:MAG: Nif3-like dinuclear metal center hexameric protein [Clostridia bacterium]|nr:Nif3-like dinuclear metal center hexameric protein [Clostridia bacterium]